MRGPLEIARTQLTITSRQSEAHIADLLATAAVEYWSAVQARDGVKVLQQTLELAQENRTITTSWRWIWARWRNWISSSRRRRWPGENAI